MSKIPALDTAFAQMGDTTARQADTASGLTDREKVFLTLTADVCQQCLGLPFELHVRAGLEQGVSTSDMRNLLRAIAFDSGYHAALAAFERLAEIESALGLPQPEVEPLAAELLSIGPDAPTSGMPAPVRAVLTALDPHLAEYFDIQFRMRPASGSDTLTVRERTLMTTSIDVHYQTLGDSFRLHIERVLRLGVPLDDVRGVLRFIAQFGATRVWRGWEALHAHAAEAGWTDSHHDDRRRP